MEQKKGEGRFPSFPSPTPIFHFWLSPHFPHGQNIKNPVLCSQTPRKRLLRRLRKSESNRSEQFRPQPILFEPVDLAGSCVWNQRNAMTAQIYYIQRCEILKWPVWKQCSIDWTEKELSTLTVLQHVQIEQKISQEIRQRQGRKEGQTGVGLCHRFARRQWSLVQFACKVYHIFNLKIPDVNTIRWICDVSRGILWPVDKMVCFLMISLRTMFNFRQ